jgi:hypothetical protein
MDICTVTLKNPMRRHSDKNEEVSRRSTTHPGFTFPRKTNAGAVFNAWRDIDRQGFFFSHPALTGTRPAGFFNDATGTLASGARAFDCEKALLRSNTSAAVTRRTGYRFRTGFRAGAMALVTSDEIRDANCRLLAAETLFQANFEIIT